jgi:hypothetical protein
MRYATWKVNFEDNPKEGTTPERFVKLGNLDSYIYVAPFTIMGYVSDDADLSDLEKWEVSEITSEEALAFAKIDHADSLINENGFITKPDRLLGA